MPLEQLLRFPSTPRFGNVTDGSSKTQPIAWISQHAPMTKRPLLECGHLDPIFFLGFNNKKLILRTLSLHFEHLSLFSSFQGEMTSNPK